MVESCWARESPGLTEACFGLYGLSLTLALAVGVQLDHPVSVPVSTEHKHWEVNIYQFCCEPCSGTMCSCPIAFVTNVLRISMLAQALHCSHCIRSCIC